MVVVVGELENKTFGLRKYQIASGGGGNEGVSMKNIFEKVHIFHPNWQYWLPS